MDVISEIKNTVTSLEEAYAGAQKIVRSCPTGSIRIANDPDYLRISWVYFENGKRVRRGIKGRKELMKSLLRKAYYKEYASRLKCNIDLLKSVERQLVPMDPETIMKKMPANIHLLDEDCKILWEASMMHPVFDQSVSPAVFTAYIPEAERDAWAGRAYRVNGSYREHLLHKTSEGLYMRSKGEMGLLEIYKRHHFATHYDEVLRFGNVCKSPDFVSMRSDGKLIIHEHCGMVNDAEYMRRHRQKLAVYEACGIVPWDNLIVTYEASDGSIDLKLAEAEICAKLEMNGAK